MGRDSAGVDSGGSYVWYVKHGEQCPSLMSQSRAIVVGTLRYGPDEFKSLRLRSNSHQRFPGAQAIEPAHVQKVERHISFIDESIATSLAYDLDPISFLPEGSQMRRKSFG